MDIQPRERQSLLLSSHSTFKCVDIYRTVDFTGRWWRILYRERKKFCIDRIQHSVYAVCSRSRKCVRHLFGWYFDIWWDHQERNQQRYHWDKMQDSELYCAFSTIWKHDYRSNYISDIESHHRRDNRAQSAHRRSDTESHRRSGSESHHRFDSQSHHRSDNGSIHRSDWGYRYRYLVGNFKVLGHVASHLLWSARSCR